MLNIFLCGLYGALATVFGKFSVSNNFLIGYINSTCLLQGVSSSYCNHCSLIFRGVMFACMLGSNGLMLANFLKALEKSSSIVVTTVSSSASFILTGLLGSVLLSEKVGFQWMFGALCIILGIGFIVMSQISRSKS